MSVRPDKQNNFLNNNPALTAEALRESEQWWHLLIKNLPDFILTVDRNGTILALNRTVTGIRVKDAIGRSIYDYVPPNSSGTVKKSLKRVFRTGKFETFEILGTGPKGPDSAWYETRVLPMKRDKQIIAVTLIALDISERKKAEEARRQSEEMYATLVDTFPDAVTLTDLEGRITYVSRQTLKLHGFKKEDELFGKSAFELIAPEDHEKAMANLKKTLNEGSVRDRIYRLRRKDGSCFIGELNASLIKNVFGKPKAFIATTRDISQRKQAEKALKDSETKLREQKQALEQKNIALSEIIKQIEVEKTRIKDDILDNINEILLPILAKLRIKKATRKYVDLLQYHLKELASSFGRKIAEKTLRLTSREIEVCSMVKGGLTSKEISDLLSISYQTVEKHRRNIRYKLGIANKDINLTSFLHTI